MNFNYARVSQTRGRQISQKGKGISREIFRGSRDFSRQVWGSPVKKFEIPELSICQRRRSFGDDVT